MTRRSATMKETRYVRSIVLLTFHADLKHLSVLAIVEIKNPEAAAIINAAKKFKFQHCFRDIASQHLRSVTWEDCEMAVCPGRVLSHSRPRTVTWSAVIYIPNLTSTTTWSRFANQRSSSWQVDTALYISDYRSHSIVRIGNRPQPDFKVSGIHHRPWEISPLNNRY